MLQKLIPFVLETIGYVIMTLIAIILVFGTTGRNGALGRIVDGLTIQTTYNVTQLADRNTIIEPTCGSEVVVSTTTF